MFVQRGRRRHRAKWSFAVDGVRCAGCIREIEHGLKDLPGVVNARLNFTNRRLSVDWRDAALDPGQAHRGAAAARLSRLSVPAGTRRGRGGAPGQMAAAMPGGRRLRRHEHHAAVGVGLVRQCHRHDAGDARLLPLAVGADRACRPPPMPASRSFAAPSARLRARQVNMDVPISLGVVLALGMSVVETAGHAEHAYFDSAIMLLFFLLVRALSRSRHAAQDARRGRQSRGAARRRWRIGSSSTARSCACRRRPAAGRPVAGAARRSRSGRRYDPVAAAPRSTRVW